MHEGEVSLDFDIEQCCLSVCVCVCVFNAAWDERRRYLIWPGNGKDIVIVICVSFRLCLLVARPIDVCPSILG